MLGGRQTIFLTPYFQFEKRFDFVFVYVMNTCDYFLCLPSWHHGKRSKLSWKSHGILLSDFCGNPECDDPLMEIHVTVVASADPHVFQELLANERANFRLLYEKVNKNA